MLHDILSGGASELGVTLSSDQVSKFILYMDELLFWNEKINLTSITDKKDIIVKHFLDSLAVLKALHISDQTIVDFGAGAGLPGIPVSIVRPKARMLLLDSVKKKIDFLNHVIKLLDLDNTRAKWERAEDFGRAERDQYDIALARALAPLNVLIEYCVPALKVGGLVAALKSDKVDGEISEAANALEELASEIVDVVEVTLPGTDICRKIVIIKKLKDTPQRYPRVPGAPRKKPL